MALRNVEEVIWIHLNHGSIDQERILNDPWNNYH
jgi:hypothetical protein